MSSLFRLGTWCHPDWELISYFHSLLIRLSFPQLACFAFALCLSKFTSVKACNLKAFHRFLLTQNFWNACSLNHPLHLRISSCLAVVSWYLIKFRKRSKLLEGRNLVLSFYLFFSLCLFNKSIMDSMHTKFCAKHWKCWYP